MIVNFDDTSFTGGIEAELVRLQNGGGQHVVTEWVDEAQVAELGVARPSN